MTTTLITDDFAPGENPAPLGDPLVHDLVYGALGRTDLFDTTTIHMLLDIGAIVKERTESGPGWITNIYTSVHGSIPETTT